jgi:hypothetical protein
MCRFAAKNRVKWSKSRNEDWWSFFSGWFSIKNIFAYVHWIRCTYIQGLPDPSLYNTPKLGKYTKWPKLCTKFTDIFPFQGPPKYIQIGIKIYHQVTVVKPHLKSKFSFLKQSVPVFTRLVLNTKWPHTYNTDIFHSKALQNIPKLVLKRDNISKIVFGIHRRSVLNLSCLLQKL